MSNPESPLVITENRDVSIEQLVALHGQGTSVMRSAHIGNLRPYNQVLAVNGIPMLLVDHNVTGVDRNYFPELRIEGGVSTQIAPLGALSCKLSVDGVSLPDTHINGILSAFPDASVFTNTDYVRQNESVSGEIIAIAAATQPDLFMRLAQSDGSVIRVNRTLADRISEIGIMQLQDDPTESRTGIMLPNEVDIVLNFVVEALRTGLETQYHLSGPDMVQYLADKKGSPSEVKQRVFRLFEDVKSNASFGGQLPRTTEVMLVPTTPARFATTAQQAPGLKNLVDTILDSERLLALSTLKEERAECARAATCRDDAFRSLMSDFDRRELELLSPVGVAATGFPDLFAEDKSPNFSSQYDVTTENPLFVPPQILGLTMRELDGMFLEITKTLKRIRR